jgi:hypothetical protein
MAVTESDQAPLVEPAASEPAPKPNAVRPGPRRAPPVWVTPSYLAGLVLVYVGERLLPTLDKGHLVVTVLGLIAVAGATAIRFSPRFRAEGDRQQIENLQAIFSLIGIAGVAVYFASTDWGLDHIGYAAANIDKRASASGFLTVVWVSAIAIATLPMIFAETALLPMRSAERPESRRVRAAAGNGLVLALAATYTTLFVYFGSSLELKADYSYFKTSKPSDSTRKIAQSFRDPVKVTAFFPDVNEVRTEVRGYLTDLARGTPNFKVEFKDRLLVPKDASDLHVTADGTIVFAKGTSNERLQISTKIDEARPKLKTLDREIQEKLIKLVRSRRTAYLTVGHGELNDPARGSQAAEGHTADGIRMLLEKLNYQPRELGIGQGLGNEIPDDAGIVLILGPSQPFAPEEIVSLKRYADRGGHLFMALDPDTIYADDQGNPLSTEQLGGLREVAAKADAASKAKTETPGKHDKKEKPAIPAAATSGGPAAAEQAPAAGRPKDAVLASLAELANVVGLKYSGDILANDKRFVPRRYNDSDRVILFSSSFSSHASVSTLSRHAPQAAIIVSGAGSLDKGDGASDKVDFTVRSMPGTFSDINRDYRQEAPAERSTTFNLAAAVTRASTAPKPVAKPPKGKDGKDSKDTKDVPEPDEMRAFVVSDADVFSDMILPRFGGNVVLFADAIRWLGGEESFAGEAQSEEDVRIEHTRQADLLWFYATIFGAPALVLGVGLTVVQRSRRFRGGKR